MEQKDQIRRDRELSQRAIDLAARGIGLVSPNPLVGCVVVSADGEIVGEGIYTYEGVVHAELIALKQAGGRARNGTAYVSLEPHDYHGKTPPCTDALINAGITRLVCPIEDPNPLVSGRGFATLRMAGIDVIVGILADAALKLNEKFICWHQKQRPFVHLKLAMSLDGRISLSNSVSTALSGDKARSRVQEFRHEHDAILIGGTTALIDNPSLTDRSGRLRRRPLTRVVLDNRLQLPVDSTLTTTTADSRTIIFTNNNDLSKIDKFRGLGVEVVILEFGGRDLEGVLAELKLQNIQSVLVEGGSEIAGAFLDAKLVDKVSLIVTPVIIGGHAAPVAVGGKGSASLEAAMRLRDVAVDRLGEDIEITGYPYEAAKPIFRS